MSLGFPHDVIAAGINEWNHYVRLRSHEIILEDTDFRFHKNLKGINFGDVVLARCDFRGCDLTEASFDSATCPESNFQDATLRSAKFWKAGLKNSNFENADLSMANLLGADMSATKLSGAILRETELTAVDFHRANVKSTVTFRKGRKIFRSTDFSNSVNLTQAQVDTMIGDNRTILPKSIATPTHWIVLPEDLERQPSQEKSNELKRNAVDIAARWNASPSEIRLTILSVCQLVADEKERLRGRNAATDEEAEESRQQVQLLDLIEGRLGSVVSSLPNEHEITEQEASDIASILNSYQSELTKWLEENRPEMVDNTVRIALMAATTSVFSLFGLSWFGAVAGAVGFYGKKAPKLIEALKGKQSD